MTPREILFLLIWRFREGQLATVDFCDSFEGVFNRDLDKTTLSASEAAALGDLFERVVWYSPFEEERATIPFDLNEDDIARAAEIAAIRLDLFREPPAEC